MKAVFVGGGSFRILPLLREAFRHPEIFGGGRICLVDRNEARAKMVGRMIRRTPEYRNLGCRVSSGRSLDRALEGADVLYVTFGIGSPETGMRSAQACRQHGFISSDQLSPTGAFLSLVGGPTILDFARRMERRCPRARMLIFANPVAVYSGLVNNHTTIRALGLCAGYTNHRWDLTRLMGRDEYCDEYDVDVAGVNHLSFILQGTFHGEDLFEVLRRSVGEGWRPPRIRDEFRHLEPYIRPALRRLAQMLHRYGTVIFSTESDGMAHLFYREMYERTGAPPRAMSLEQVGRHARKSAAARTEAERRYASFVDADLDDSLWAASHEENPWFGRNDRDVAIPVLQAWAGMGRRKVVASAPNRGAVAGFKNRTVLEYSMRVDRRGYRAAGRYDIPDVFHGLVAALASHQTLLGDAVAARDPRTLADALTSYPILRGSRAARAMWRDLLVIFSAEIPSEFAAAGELL